MARVPPREEDEDRVSNKDFWCALASIVAAGTGIAATLWVMGRMGMPW